MTTHFDSRELMSGKDGRLYASIRGFTFHIAEISQYAIWMEVETKTYRPIGSILVHYVPQNVSFFLTYTEMVVRDGIVMEPLLKAIKEGEIPTYSFQSVAVKPDRTEQRFTLDDAVPNGTFGIQTLVPGEVVEREMSFALNKVPEFISSLASTYMFNPSHEAIDKYWEAYEIQQRTGLLMDPEL